MTLKLYFHPFASFCWKALIALYENETPFSPVIVDLGDPVSRAAFLKVWPIGKFPVLRDEARDETVPESSIIIEYLALHYPGASELAPADPERARQTRLRDRFFDFYVHAPMQKIVADRLRPEGRDDPAGVEEARGALQVAYDLVDEAMGKKTWAMGEAFTMADCAAAPALYYAQLVAPFGARANLQLYLERLLARPSFARVVKEAEPYRDLFPKERRA